MRKIHGYILVNSASPSNLSHQIKCMLDGGWELYGHHTIQGATILQAMVKYTDEHTPIGGTIDKSAIIEFLESK